MVKIVLGFASICAIIAAIGFWNGRADIGGLFIAIGLVVVIVSIWLGSRGAA